MRVALISCNGRTGNAIGNQLAEKLRFFVERGADVRLFVQSAESLHSELASCAHVVADVETSGPVWDYLAAADLILADYPHWYDLLHYLPLVAGKKPRIVVEYHGVTPPSLWDDANRALLEEGQVRRGVVWCADAVIAHSRFTREELLHSTGVPAA